MSSNKFPARTMAMSEAIGPGIPSVLRSIASKGGSVAMGEAMEKRSSRNNTAVTPYMCYCRKCEKISPIETSVEAVDLLKKVFCPECAGDLFRKKRNLNDEIEKMEIITEKQIETAAKEHNRSIKELEEEVEKHKEKINNTRQGILVLEEDLGTGIILCKEELKEAMFEQFIYACNRKKNDKQESEEKVLRASPNGNVGIGPTDSDDDNLGSICRRIFDDRLRKEKETTEAVEKKGW